MQRVYVLLTMDCETPRADVTEHAALMSASGPADYTESDRAIRGYAETAAAWGYPVTLLAHPEVAAGNTRLLLNLQQHGACLGLHLHPYKMAGSRHFLDLGAYTAAEQTEILTQALERWHHALGQHPRYFRAGYFSASDVTFGVLSELGFRGGSLSNPGRVLPAHCSVWAGAEPYPHRAHTGFRLLSGESDFVEVPVSSAFGRPVARGHAGERGFEWPYIPHSYDHREVIRDLLRRFAADQPAVPVLVTDTHNDQDYTDPGHPARRNLEVILTSIRDLCAKMDMEPVGVTLDTTWGLV